MSSLPAAVAAALRKPVGAEMWAALTAALEAEPGADLAEVEAALRAWDRDVVLRQPSCEQWSALQSGGATPPWWPLVRHIRFGEGDRLDHLPTGGIRSIRIQPDVAIDADLLASLPPAPRLDLSGCAFHAADIVSAFAARARLSVLILSRSHMDDAHALVGLGSLVRLRIDGGSATLADLSGDGLEALQELDISATKVDSFAPLAARRSLATLVANRCTGRPAAGPLVDHPSLTRILVDGTPLDESGLDAAAMLRLHALRASPRPPRSGR